MAHSSNNIVAEQKRKTILVVEDEAIIALSQKLKLENEGYDVILASSGEKALEITGAHAAALDLILMDINLGAGIDGTVAAQKILTAHNIPILFISSYSDKETVEKTEKITSYGYLVKDSSPAILFASIKMALRLFEANQKILETENDYRSLFNNSLNAIGLHEIILDESGVPIDYVFLRVNSAFERHSGLRAVDVLNKPVTQVVPNITQYGLIEKYGRVALTGEPTSFEFYSEADQQYYSISAFQTGQNRFAAVFENITEHKQSENGLKEAAQRPNLNEEKFHDLFERAPLGYQSLDHHGCILEVNQAWLDTLGYAREEVLGRWFGDFLAPEVVDDFRTHFPILKANGKIHSEYPMLHKDGSRRFIALESSIGYHADGAFRQTYCILSDITERIQQEQALRLFQARVQTFFNASPNAILVADDTGRYLAANPAAAEMLGYSQAQMLGMHVSDLQTSVLPDAGERYRLYLQKGKETGEFDFIRPDGACLKANYFAMHIQENFNISILNDITLQRKAEADLHQNRKILQAIIDKSATCLVYLDPKFNFVTVNDTYARSCRMTPEELLGKNHFSLFPHAENEVIFRQVRDTGQPVSYHDKAFTYPDQPERGATYWDWTLTPVKNDSGTVEGLTFSLVETTERVRAEEKITHLLHEKELLLREVHHRIKNNMSTITSLINLQIHGLRDESVKMALQDTAGRIQSINVLYNRLNRSGDINTLSLREYLPPLLDEIVGIFPNAASVSIQTRIDDIILQVDLLSHIGIILNELVTNAMKYAFQGQTLGSITLTAERQPAGIVIVFSDTGIGLPETVTFNNSPSLGLHLVEMLVKQMGGTISIDRIGGTRYYIEIPA